MRFNHGAPVDAMVLFPAGSTMASAGGQYVKVRSVLLLSVAFFFFFFLQLEKQTKKETSVLSLALAQIWDLLTGKLMHTLTSHQKAVTALALGMRANITSLYISMSQTTH